ncbi:unnamed protein product [Cyprideis torosa]|uniref:ubiquitinyl hydrolase 1 n=1 Tax=Cyprideis torosa TaxID=163714 RepID=A0A7R8WRL9_9CRUS|nr:unnamed protein product [Cyprideis torosa]CAG0903846.1 unnamed protein product [Cyprideis torosa]
MAHSPSSSVQNDDIRVGDIVVHMSREYGTKRCIVRWVGYTPSRSTLIDGPSLLYGVEFEEPIGNGNGALEGQQMFIGKQDHVAFVSGSDLVSATKFYGKDQDVVKETWPPLDHPHEITGRFKGIQGHKNSCYLDATLFAMFSFSSAFDCVLFRPRSRQDIAEYDAIQSVVRDEIVNPLRKYLFVKAEHVMKLREMIGHLSVNPEDFTAKERDPEEFFQLFFGEALRAKPFLRLSTGQESFFHQLIVEKDETLRIPTVQRLFDQSCLNSEVKFKEIPAVLVLQMPRFGNNFKLYQKIQPSQALDITDAIEGGPRTCFGCERLADWECVGCFHPDHGLASTAFCSKCMMRQHSIGKVKTKHKPVKLELERAIRMSIRASPPRSIMELFAVVCIETSHYVSFVKAGQGADALWCFFDSMADREGESDGFNIPEVSCQDLSFWIKEENLHQIEKEGFIPEIPKRMLSDASLCFYQNHDMLMYR